MRPFDSEFSTKHYEDSLAHTGLTSAFNERVDAWRSPHLWDKQRGEWVLPHAAWQDDHVHEAAAARPAPADAPHRLE